MIQRHFNLNSVLISLACAIGTFCLKRADDINTKVILLTNSQTGIVERLDRMERDAVLRTEFRNEIDRIEREINDPARNQSTSTPRIQAPKPQYR